MRRISRLAGSCLFFWASSALAQVPSGVQPGQIVRSQQAPREPSVPLNFPSPSSSNTPVDAAPAGAENIRFVLRDLKVEGATVYTAEALQSTYQGDIGKEITLARVYGIANELTARYRNDGYILSQVIVLAQSVKDGVVTLRAVEGYVFNVNIQGSAGAPEQINAYTSAIKAVRPLTASALERYLLLINDIPGVAALATLSPSSEPGAADLTVSLEQRSYFASFGLNNRNTRLIGPLRANLDVDFNGLTGADRVGLRLLQTPANSELTLGSLLYDRVVSSGGLKVNLAYTQLVSHPEATLALPDLRSDSQSGSAGLTYPLLRSRLQNLNLRATYSQHDGNTDASGAPLFRDHVRAARFGASYDLVDGLRGINLFDLEWSQGLSVSGATAEGDPLASRAGATPTFQKVTFYAARLQSLAPRWSLLAALSGQDSKNNLLSPEQFAFGGADFGRGYDASDLTGDAGAAGKLELRYSGAGFGFVRDYTLYAFYDRGCIHNNSAAPADDCADSSGLGARFSATHGISGYVEYAKPVNHDIPAEGDRKSRVFAGLTVDF